jgi:hypothetical protein
MEDQITMTFSSVMDEVISILKAEEAVTVVALSSTQRPKRHRCYVNRDSEAAYFRLRRDYLDDDCMYPPSYFCQRYRM